ncbi:RUS1 family protein C16orf58 homolog isoform X3 [Hoplias malabaricus]|uniref:RUS1 family protein C16orf58 homolog isoform X3 n=1 Tax=Hoplias malabaricus TaxID=27720 RepID=UPI003462B6DB
MDATEGLIATEKFGSQETWRYQVKSGGLKRERVGEDRERPSSSITAAFKSVFLPQGYPESVSEDYLHYQLWDTLQAFSSSLSGTLATQASLRGIGVGNQQATVAAATVTWILKDGTGMLGRILFAWMKGFLLYGCGLLFRSKLDSEAKKWRLFADILNDIAMFMEILAPHFPPFFTLIVCVAGIFKETLVNLAGLLVSLVLIPLVTNNPMLTFLLFFLFTALHLFANYKAVRSVVMETLNEARLSILLHQFLHNRQILSPAQANQREPVFLEFKQNVPVRLGVCLGDVIKNPQELQLALKNNTKDYLIGIQNGSVCVCLGADASVHDEIMAYSQAVCISTVLHTPPPRDGELKHLYEIKDSWELVSESHKLIDRIFQSFITGLERAKWETDRTLLNWNEWRVEWRKKRN